MRETLGWYKDQWLDIDKILISANNRGLKFGDGIFETILIKKNKPILFDEHLKRLEKSSKLLDINLKINELTLKKLINDVSVTSIAFSPNIDLSNFSSGPDAVSPLGVTLPTKISPGFTSAPM